MRLHLILGLLWLGVGLAILFPQVSGLETRKLNLGNVQFSAGWLVLAMAVYNFARWYGVYSVKSQRKTEAQAWDRLTRSRREETTDRDPNFDFRDPPAQT